MKIRESAKKLCYYSLTCSPKNNTNVCDRHTKVVVPNGGRERTHGYQLRMETAPVLLIDFSLMTLNNGKLEETGKEKEEEE